MAGSATLGGKWVLVTGGASGIGLATAEAFAQRGANVVLTDVNAAALDTAQAGLCKYPVDCRALRCDVASAEAVFALAARLENEIGPLDVLVNNAGVAFLGGFLETPLEQSQRILQVNVMGVMHMIHAFLPAMLTAPGPRQIVNVASAAAYLPAPNMAAYAASKGAVRQLSEVLAMELAGSNVSVQVIYPGIINTPIIGGVQSRGGNISDRQLETLKNYYATKGCNPEVVGEDIVKSVMAGTQHVYSGPMARLGNIVARLSSGLARAISLKAARSNGYLPAR